MRLLALVLLLISTLTISAQSNTVPIKGKVVTEDGNPLPGASVYIDKSTIGEKSAAEGMVTNYNLGTIADADGAFSLAIPQGVTHLTCGFIGFESQQIDIRNKSVITIVMKETGNSLNTVVVTGYQKIEKRKLTSAVSTIKADDILQSGVSSVDLMLSGQVAGAATTVLSGAPGAPAKIRIRGTASMNGTQDPLWVLDGVPLDGTNLPDMTDTNIDQLFTSSIAGINPSDIADITILKDAAATAIYGARAANGVILVTTKKGKTGRPIVQLNSRLSFTSRPNMDKLNLMNSSEKLDMELGLAKYADLDSYNTDTKKGAIGRLFEQNNLWDQYRAGGLESLPANIQSEIANLRNINTVWGDELYRTAVNQDHSLSISGGTDRISYYFSAGYYDELGTTIGASMRRLNFTLKTDYKILDNLTVGVAMFSNERKQGSYLTTNSVTNPSRYSRIANAYLPVYDANGGYAYDMDIPLKIGKMLDYNIIEERENTTNDSKVRSTNSIFNVEWNILRNLSFRTQLGLQRDNTKLQEYASKNSFYTRYAREKSMVGGTPLLPQGGIIKNTDETFSLWNLKSVLEYNTTFGDKHELDIMAGNELRRSQNERIFSAGYGYDKEKLTTLPIIFPNETYASSYPLFSKGFVENAFVSFFGTVGYTFDHKYTFFGSMRVDGSDMFGVDNKYRYTPLWSASAAWRVSEESFMKDLRWISDLKLRASYGLQGNIDKNTSKYLIGDRKTAVLLPGQIEPTIAPSNLPNERLRWEKTATWNGGLDLSVLNNRVTLSLDAYYRKSSDLIAVKQLPLQKGIPTISLNWAEMTNNGVELTLATRNIDTRSFKWNTTINIAKNTNRVDEDYVPYYQTTPSLKGHSVNSLFAFKTAGLDEQGYILFDKDGEKLTATEFFGLVDPYGGGLWYEPTLSNEEIRNLYTHIGDKDPKLSGGIINNFQLGRFSLNVSCAFNLGQWVKTEPFYDVIEMDRGSNRTTMMNKVWTPDNTSGTYPRMIGSGTENGERMGDYMALTSGLTLPVNVFRDLDIWYKKINYLRVNSMRLGYDVPTAILSKAGISALRINVEARNLFVIASNYDGYFDPETFGSFYAQPIPKSITVGMNITF